MTFGTSLYCGDNCNHTGEHRYPPRYTTGVSLLDYGVRLNLGYPVVHEPSCNDKCDGDWHWLDNTREDDPTVTDQPVEEDRP